MLHLRHICGGWWYTRRLLNETMSDALLNLCCKWTFYRLSELMRAMTLQVSFCAFGGVKPYTL